MHKRLEKQATMKTIRLSKFKNGLSMAELSKLFHSDWEMNRFQTEAINAGLIRFIPKYGKLYKTDFSAKSVIIDEKTGSIIEIQ